jgi:hypothetical protein
MRRTEVAIAVAVAAAVGIAVGVNSGGGTGAGIAAAGVAVLGVGAERLVSGRYRSWGYCERAQDLLVRRGLLFRRLTVVPYGRMQLVDVTAGAAERVFGLATVKLHTAAATTDARIPGLPPAEADRLRDRLARLGEAQAAGV